MQWKLEVEREIEFMIPDLEAPAFSKNGLNFCLLGVICLVLVEKNTSLWQLDASQPSEKMFTHFITFFEQRYIVAAAVAAKELSNMPC